MDLRGFLRAGLLVRLLRVEGPSAQLRLAFSARLQFRRVGFSVLRQLAAEVPLGDFAEAETDTVVLLGVSREASVKP